MMLFPAKSTRNHSNIVVIIIILVIVIIITMIIHPKGWFYWFLETAKHSGFSSKVYSQPSQHRRRHHHHFDDHPNHEELLAFSFIMVIVGSIIHYNFRVDLFSLISRPNKAVKFFVAKKHTQAEKKSWVHTYKW